ncbi:MAG TPA: hypothetical protein VNO70_18485 [Blastocatellia bacterium]|nr:hypothetical protein [Blastocatellia bacterium]
MKATRLLFTISWVALLLVSIALVLGSFGSLVTAYSGAQDNLTPNFTMEQIQNAGGAEAVNAYRGRRITAATWALAYALLSFFVVLIPYRRGERWAWIALLAAISVSQLLSIGRALALGSTFGLGTPTIILSVALLGLIAGLPHLFARKSGPEI